MSTTIDQDTVEYATDDQRWAAILARDAAADGSFVFGVRSTGIYCRPSCPARKPRREHIQYLSNPDEAEDAGYRPCKRCKPREERSDLAMTNRAIELIDGWEDGSPTLAELGERTGVSPGHLQRTFKRVMGVSPAAYARAKRAERLRSHLRNGSDVTTSLYAAGFDSSAPLYASAGEEFGMTPGRYRTGGAGVTIRYARADSPLGRMLVAYSDVGVTAIRFGDTDDELEGTLRAEYPEATLEPDGDSSGWIDTILEYLRGDLPHPDLPVDVRATAFQRRVWEALRSIRPGTTQSYGEVARAIGRPEAARAVAQACASNRVPLVIPCHRVVRSDGAMGGYRWGEERKRWLLALESGGEASSSAG